MKHLHFTRLRAAALIVFSVIITFTMISLPGSYVNAGSTETYTSSQLTYELDAGSRTAKLTDIDESLADVDIPSTVTKDGVDYTVNAVKLKEYHGYDNVSSIRFPSTVKTVYGLNVPNLNGQLQFPEGVEEISYVSAKSAASVKFPGTLKTIHAITFQGISSIEFPSSVTGITGQLRLGDNIREVTIPGSVKHFGASFSSCKNLETVTFQEGVESIDNGSGNFFDNCPNVKTVTYADSIKEINKPWMFSGLTKLENVKWPAGDFTVKDNCGMFNGCTSLKKLDLPAGVTPDGAINSSMFSGCANLEEVNFGNDIVSIGGYAFYNCKKLNNVSLGSKVTSIGDKAFYQCKELTEVPDLSKVTEMGSSAFSKCGKMKGKADLSSLNEIPDYAFYGTKITEVTFSNDLAKIGKQAFIYTRLTSVEIPDSVVEIGPYAFFNITTLENVRIGSGVETLDDGTFMYCGKLKDVEIGSGITSIDDSVFSGCSKVEKAKIHSSEDRVEVNDIGSLPHAKIEFTEESVGDVGDNIGGDGPHKDWSLQKAVNEAENGGTVTIYKHVKLNRTLTVPDGKTVTIKSKDNKSILAEKNAQLDGGKLIDVGKGRTLKLEDVTVRGFGSKVSGGNGLINVSGSFTLGSNAVISDTKLSDTDSAAVRVAGNNAKFDMDGGSIKQVRRSYGSSQYVAPVRVTDNAVFNMKGGSITGNSVKEADSYDSLVCSGGVMLDRGASMNMTGGEISGNTAHTGSAIYVKDKESKLVIGGDAKITGNKCVRNNKLRGSCGGAVHNEGSMTLNEGTLENNESYNVGGAIAVTRTGTFEMNGGTVRGNSATRCGGGIYLYGSDLRLNAGTIENNTAGTEGGGVYVEGNMTEGYATAHFANTLVRNNSASIMGGGVWVCPTGRAYVENNSAAVYENNATAGEGSNAAGDDFALVAPAGESIGNTDPASNNVSGRALGGGHIRYFYDNSIWSAGLSDWGQVNSGSRYDSSNAAETHVDNDTSRSYALKSVPDSDDVKTLAESSAKLVITGNKAQRGGGIGANGGLVFEGGGEKKINIEKVWSGKDPTVDSVTLGIYVGDSKIDTVTLKAEDGWKGEITGLSDDLTAADITVKEETTVENFVATFDITDSEDGTAINVVATNTYNEPPLTPDTPEPQNPTPDNPNPTNPDNPVKVTTDNPQSGVPTGDTFPTAVGITALAAGLTAMIAAYMRRRRAAAGK